MSRTLYIAFLFIFLLLLQVFVLNNILFLGYINPYLYVAFVLLYPLNKERFGFLLTTFLFGLSIDFFTNSGGINAFSLLFVAYIRLFFVRITFKKTPQEYQLFNLLSESANSVFNYVVSIVFIHHFLLFSLSNFGFDNFIDILKNTLFSCIFTVLLFLIGIHLFRKKTK